MQIVWGMRDWCFHAGILKKWQSILPDVPVHRLENAGHYLIEDAPDEVISRIKGFIGQA